MTYKQFLNELKERLKRLPSKDRDEALRYYEEYFAEAGTSREEEVLKELRSPAHVASKILSDYALKESSNAKKATYGNFRAVWFIILGIFAAPIAFPLAIALAIVIISLCFVMFAAIFGLIVGGGILIFIGIPMLFFDIGSAFLLFGTVLVGIGLTQILICIVKALINGISGLVKKV